MALHPPPRTPDRRPRWGTALLVLCGLWGSSHAADPAMDTSVAVAQTVWGIMGYTRWPADPQPLQLCLVGESAHSAPLLAGGDVAGGRAVVVRRITAENSPPLSGCHALYAGQLRAGQWQKLLATLTPGQPLLTISEQPSTCQLGGMFCLDIAPRSVGFELNLDSMARSGVRVSPRVFGLSRRREGL